MLQTMRSNMKVILWITIIFFVLLVFLVWGADLQFGSGPQPNTIGSVNGTPISTSDYQQVLAFNRRSAQAQGIDLQPTDELLIEEQTWNSLINETLLNQEAERRGLEAKNAEIRSMLLNNPPEFITQDPNFRDAQGRFSLATYRAVIQDPSTPESYLIQLENYMRGTLPAQKLQGLIASSAKVTEDELRRRYLEDNEKATITYVLVEASGGDTADPSEAELRAYYDSHLEDYAREEAVDIRYISIPRVPTAEDTASIRADLLEYASDARKARTSDDLQYSDFASLAQTFSDSPTAEDGGLSPGYVTAEELSPVRAAALEGLQPGEISDPFQDGGYFNIVQVESLKVEGGVPAYRYRELSLRIEPSDSTVTAVSDQLTEIRQAAVSSGLAEAASAHNLTLRVAEDVTPGDLVPGLVTLPQIADFARESPTGTLSRIMSTNSAWYLVEVGDHQPAGIAPFEAVRDQVRADLLQERGYEATREVADLIRSRVDGGMSLEDAAAAVNLSVVTTPPVSRSLGLPNLGRDFEVLAAMFSRQPGEIAGPVKGLRGWVVLRVDDRTEPDWQAFEANRARIYQNQISTKQSRLMDAYLDQLRRKATIEDYRGI